MKTQTFETNKGTIYLVDLPEGATDVKTAKDRFNNPVKWYRRDKASGEITLPPGDWKPLGLLPDISEDQAKEVVDSLPALLGLCRHYRDYKVKKILTVDPYTIATALESLQSLLETEISLKNPLGERFYADLPAFPDSSDYEEVDQCREEWENAESQVWKNPFLIFKTK